MPQLLTLAPDPPLRNLTFRITRLRPLAIHHALNAIQDLCPRFPALRTVFVVFDIQGQTTEDNFLHIFTQVFAGSFKEIDDCLRTCGPLHRMQWMRAVPSVSAAPVKLTFPQLAAFLDAKLPRLKAAGILHFDWNFRRNHEALIFGFTLPSEL
jgi:hypothetical protein